MLSRPAPASGAPARRSTAAASSIALLHVGLDKVRGLNAAYGWPAVDELLADVARELARALPQAPPLDLGQDRFELQLLGADERTAHQIAEIARDAVARCAVIVDGTSLRTTASVGYAVGDASDSRADLRVAADLALSEAKRAGGDCATLFLPVTRLDLGRESRLIGAIRAAVESGRIIIHAQPVQALDRGVVEHWELFARLRLGDGPLLPSGEFLPLALRAGLMAAVDRTVAARAIEVLSTGDEGLALEVNVSAPALREPGFLELLRERCATLSVEPRRLIMDVSEETSAEPQQLPAGVLAALREAGFRLALDNFGRTGGSLEQLRRFTFDFVKFDACFVRNLPAAPRDRQVLRAAAQLARTLEARPVACFVPDEATLKLVRACGVDLAQGFHLGRPRPLGEVG